MIQIKKGELLILESSEDYHELYFYSNSDERLKKFGNIHYKEDYHVDNGEFVLSITQSNFSPSKHELKKILKQIELLEKQRENETKN